MQRSPESSTQNQRHECDVHPAGRMGWCVQEQKHDGPIFIMINLSGLCCYHEVQQTAAGYLRMASAFALSIAEGPAIV